MNIVVVGAGIAGLTTAAALARAGVPCTVYEQTGELGEVGAGIQLAPNATRLLQRLGSIHLEDRGVAPEAIEMHRWDDGDVLGTTVLGQACLDRFGAPYYTFHRADLHRLLRDLLPAESLVLGHRCVAVHETADGAEVRFADGSAVTADLVIGADGIHSVARRLLADDHPRYSGQSIFRGLVPAERVPRLAADPKVMLWVGPGRHCVSYPVAGGELISFGATAPTDGWATESWTAPGSIDDLRTGYRGWHEDVHALLTAADAVNQWALHDRDPLDTWSGARVTLVGDAAHPMLPFAAQGANQAVEDAFVLAACLRDTNRDTVPEALLRYESFRRPRTSDVQLRSRSNQQQFHLSDDERGPDDGEANLRAQAALFGYDAEAEALSGTR
ncbi:FAD-dependent monooxygenase [Actinophytocola oryzae]|uniref:Salicylate hydroxylase n=1 Tax=Actinophytocola oryzae TaxID=502181 RepID=A0A4R7W5F4_9PSEU|nr:FAD-dependent monooxygenase [Actinophytocola oryzae]TDV57328.1 salicylate hydroxylase [Actinophytocola oryzae]